MFNVTILSCYVRQNTTVMTFCCFTIASLFRYVLWMKNIPGQSMEQSTSVPLTSRLLSLSTIGNRAQSVQMDLQFGFVRKIWILNGGVSKGRLLQATF